MDIGMSTASCKDLKSNGIIGISHVGHTKTVLPSLYPLLSWTIRQQQCNLLLAFPRVLWESLPLWSPQQSVQKFLELIKKQRI